MILYTSGYFSKNVTMGSSLDLRIINGERK